MPLSLEDYRHYYEGCFGKYKGKKEVPVIFVENAVYKQEEIWIKGHIIMESMWHPVFVPAHTVVYPVPEMGYVNIEDTSVFVTRIPRRQWKKGYTRNTIDLCFVPSPAVNSLRFSLPVYQETNAGNISLLYNLYNRTFPSAEEAIRLLLEGEAIARALSPQIALCVAGYSEKLALYYSTDLVGVYDTSSSVIRIDRQVTDFIPEIKQIFTNNTIEIIG